HLQRGRRLPRRVRQDQRLLRVQLISPLRLRGRPCFPNPAEVYSAGFFLPSVSHSAPPISARLQVNWINSPTSAPWPKNSSEHTTASGIFALLNTASVPALTRVAPRFHRKKHTPEASTPR